MTKAYRVAFDAPFFKTAAKHIVQQMQRDVLKLSDVAIVVPSPRMASSLAEAFARELGGSTLLPSITTLSFSENDLDDLRFETTLATNTLSPIARLMVLASLVKAKSPDLTYAQILDDAWHLGDVFTRFSAYGVSLEDLESVLPENLASGWQKNLSFLKIATSTYPAWLTEQNMLDATVETQNMMQQLVGTRFKHASHIYAIGFNDTTPAGLSVLKEIAADNRGAFIFPPFVENKENAGDVQHPFYRVNLLVRTLNIEECTILNENSDTLLNTVTVKNTAHLSLIEAGTQQEEAEIIALLMRDLLENEHGTCALVVPDRQLAARVSGALKYWNLDVDDSAGTSLMSTPVGSFVKVFLDMLVNRFNPVAVASFLYHPCTTHQKQRDVLDTFVLRGVTPRYGIEGLNVKLQESKASSAQKEACTELLSILSEQTERLRQSGTQNIAEYIENLLSNMRFWLKESAQEGEDTDAFMKVLSTLIAEQSYMQKMDLRQFQKLLEKVMETVTVRRRFGTHPRLFIWGAMEARLQDVDRVIIGGLNEGTWPRKPKADPWLNRAMNAQLGLLDTGTFIGLSAYDFWHLSHKPQVYWTRTVRDNEGETVPSRFIVQAETQWPAEVWQNMKQRGSIWQQRAEKLRIQGETTTITAPNVQVDPKDRPTVWSPSLLSKYMACPYQVFVERCLKLEQPENYEEDPTAADKGEIIHLCLEAMVHQVKGLPAPYKGKWSDSAAVEAHLLHIGEIAFGAMQHEGRKAIWWQKFKRIAFGFAQEMQQLSDRQVVAAEEQLKINLPHGISLKARFDRMDRDKMGNLYILDYKTGAIPSWFQVNSGEAPQMGVEAVLAEESGYHFGGLEYWSVKGERKENVLRKPYKDDLEDLTGAAKEGLERLAETLTAEDYTYTAVPAGAPAEEAKGACRMCDYAGMCRYKEWHK